MADHATDELGNRGASAGSGEGDKLHLGHSKLEVPEGRPGADVRRHIWVFMGLRLMEGGHSKPRSETKVNPGMYRV